MFDPYHKWLGIAQGERPPTHYQLLGISPQEQDAEVIREAAIRQTSHVRTYQTGPYAERCIVLLNEIAAASKTLLNPEKRQEYDTRIGIAKEPATAAAQKGSPIEDFCDLLVQSRLLPAAEVSRLRHTWHGQATETANVAVFAKWLIQNRCVTEYQAAMLMHGHAKHLFLGPYKLLERVGKGRLALVYKAVHDSGQIVAIKVLPPSRAKHPRWLARFQREARLARRLCHPNVVRTFDAGSADGIHYAVLEYLEGQTLQSILSERQRLAEPEALSLAYQTLLGLQHLHENGLVHRNLEPANLMLLRSAAREPFAVKILDITLARAVFEDDSSAEPDTLQVTHEGTFLGTPAYLAPEQARNAHAVDIRSDLYSLGCICYQMLTGQPPFPDASPVTQLIRHATERPRPLAHFAPDAPEGLQMLIDRLLAKDPGQRFTSPAEAAEACVPFLTETPSIPAAADLLPSYRQWLEAQHGDEERPCDAAAACDIERSLGQILQQKENLANEFYFTVFLQRYPEVAGFFANVDFKRQSALLTSALVVIVHHYLGSFPATATFLKNLGAKHHALGIPVELFNKFRDAMLATLERFHGQDWNRPLAAQWRQAIDGASAAMRCGYGA